MSNKIKIYHNPRCKHSRNGLAYLEEKTSDIEIIKYLNDGITEEEIKEILLKMHKKPSEIVRTQEAIYKANYKGKTFNDDEWIKIITENPKLIQRPIVIGKYKAVIANPPENIDSIL